MAKAFVLLMLLAVAHGVPLSRSLRRARAPKGQQASSSSMSCPDLRQAVSHMQALSKSSCIPKALHSSVSYIGGALECAVDMEKQPLTKQEDKDLVKAGIEGSTDKVLPVVAKADAAIATARSAAAPSGAAAAKPAGFGPDCDPHIAAVRKAAEGFLKGDCIDRLGLVDPMPALFRSSAKVLTAGDWSSVSSSLAPAIDEQIKAIAKIPVTIVTFASTLKAVVKLKELKPIRSRDMVDGQFAFLEDRDLLIALDKADSLEEHQAIIAAYAGSGKPKGWTYIFKDTKTWADHVCPVRSDADFTMLQEAMDDTNGCTTFGIPVPFTQKTIVDSCQIHDVGYRCGNKYGQSREQVDKLFWDNNMRQCGARYPRPFWHAVPRGLCYAVGSAAVGTVRTVAASRYDTKNFKKFCDSKCLPVMSSWQLSNFDNLEIVNDKPVAPPPPPKGNHAAERITIVSVSGAGSGDWFGKNELYVAVDFTVGGTKKKGGRTTDVKGKSAATWNAQFGVAPGATGIELKLMDEDWFKDDVLSTGSVPSSQLKADKPGWKDYTMTMKGKGKAVLSYRILYGA